MFILFFLSSPNLCLYSYLTSQRLSVHGIDQHRHSESCPIYMYMYKMRLKPIGSLPYYIKEDIAGTKTQVTLNSSRLL